MTRLDLIKRVLGVLAGVPLVGKWLIGPALPCEVYEPDKRFRRFLMKADGPSEALSHPIAPRLTYDRPDGLFVTTKRATPKPGFKGVWEVVCEFDSWAKD